jgi:hypothetical protein
MRTWTIVTVSVLALVGAYVCMEPVFGQMAEQPPGETPAAEGSPREVLSDREAALLHVCQDEKSMEMQIARYIERRNDVKPEITAFPEDENDLYLRYHIESDSGAEMSVVVDTVVSNSDDDTGRTTERAIRIVGYYVLPESAKTPEARAKLLELNNGFMNEYWSPGSVLLDEDGDVSFDTTINIPHSSVAVHAEMVSDALQRMVGAWEVYYEQLAETVDLSEALSGEQDM